MIVLKKLKADGFEIEKQQSDALKIVLKLVLSLAEVNKKLVLNSILLNKEIIKIDTVPEHC